MNYKETLYFVAKCLTIALEPRNKEAIEKQIQSDNNDWDSVVKVSTSHYVLTALYCNLKRVDFLSYLPKNLVSYMKYITDLNRDRNKQIIIQAKELNTILLKNKIRPIFIKGTGNLLAGLYEDIGERMIGDIDFIFSYEDYPKAISILRDFKYSDVHKSNYHFPQEKHHRRIQKKNNIASIEIHKELLDVIKYSREFNFNYVKKDSQIIKQFSVLSYANKLNLSIISNQINDDGFYYKKIALRNAYDVFLLSKKTDAKRAVNTLDKLTIPLNCFLSACYEIFNKVDSLEYNKTEMTVSYLSNFNKQFSNIKKTRKRHKLIKTYFFFKSRLFIIYKSLIYKEYRLWLFKRLTDKNWYKEKINQLSLKKR